MSSMFDAFWRAAAYCLHPRVVLWSLLPLLLAGGLVFGLGWLYWESTVATVRATLEQWSLVAAFLQWLDSVGGAALHTVLAPLIVVSLAVPVIVLLSLLMVAVLVTPAVVDLVVARRFPALEARRGAPWWQGVLWSFWCLLVALLALVLSVPLWLVPPLVMLLPPLIWGWMTYRVFAFDVLALHASTVERRQILREQRWQLLAMGVVCGFIGAMPSLLWAWGAITLILAPLLVVVSVWLYTLVFAFAACWFAHFCLAALQRLRAEEAASVVMLPADVPALPATPATPLTPPALPPP